ncbi:restriction endonuclease [Sphingomonas sp. YL-JM2C]
MNVFFARSKPYKIDASDIARDNKVVFLGYPLPRPGCTYNEESVHACVTPLDADEDEWRAAKSAVTKKYATQAQANRNLAAEIGAGDIALLPCAQEGVVYAGIVTTGFELLDRPPWFDLFLSRLPAGQRGGPDDMGWHAAEVAQICRVDNFVPIAISELGQLRASLLGRARFGRVAIDGPNAHALISALMQGRRERLLWTVEPEQVLVRLKGGLTPTDFEYLVVALLQLEHPEEIWHALGGSGDGGVDGAAIDESGRPTAVLQCKLRYSGEALLPEAKGRLRNGTGSLRRYVAALFHPDHNLLDASGIFLDARTITMLVIKHKDRLPVAISLRIGRAPASSAVSD